MAVMFEIKDAVSWIRFNVRIVFPKDRYGVSDNLINEKDALVEFYDTRYQSQGDRGSFISRYYAYTLMEEKAPRGLCLDGRVPDWNICEKTFNETRKKIVELCKGFGVSVEKIKNTPKGF